MRYDIKIDQDGTAPLYQGDFIPVEFEEYVSQRIYRAIMNMDVTVVSGLQSTKTDELSEALSGYLADYFGYDRHIDPAAITVSVDPMPGDDRVKFKINYAGAAPDGRNVEASTGMDYSVDGGAVLSVDYNPDWLQTPNLNSQETIQFPITISSLTTEIELPKEPFPSAEFEFGILAGVEKSLPIYLLLESQISTIDTTTEESFTINVRGNRSKYQISTALPSYERRGAVIESYEFTSNPDNLSFFTVMEYGEPIVIVENSGAGTISGTVTFRKVVQMTEEYKVKNTEVTNPAFPLRRHKGKYFAIFPKSVQLGDYYIRYTAILEE